ncbi:MAG TPA: hypothetical protein VNV66_07870, partial [Pilimelia sp.]|nr:hypothetical protein [Pilimelia sp.]
MGTARRVRHSGAGRRSPRRSGGGDMNAKPPRPGAGRQDRTARAPRPGGRVAALRAEPPAAYPTRGSAALRPEPLAPEAAEPAPRRTAGVPWLKVAPPLPVSVPRAPFVLLVLVVVVGGVLGILMVNTEIMQNAFRLENLKREQVVLDRTQQDLEKQIADLESPGNLAAQARKLGLVPAGSPAFIRLPDGRTIGVPQPAGGAPSLASGDQGGAP